MRNVRIQLLVHSAESLRTMYDRMILTEFSLIMDVDFGPDVPIESGSALDFYRIQATLPERDLRCLPAGRLSLLPLSVNASM